jgi:hypothetical protein
MLPGAATGLLSMLGTFDREHVPWLLGHATSADMSSSADALVKGWGQQRCKIIVLATYGLES